MTPFSLVPKEINCMIDLTRAEFRALRDHPLEGCKCHGCEFLRRVGKKLDMPRSWLTELAAPRQRAEAGK